MPNRSSKKRARAADLNQLAASIAHAATEGEPEDNSGKNPAAVALGRLGGQKGGIARAASLSSSRRSEIARKAAKARWSKKKKKAQI